MDEYISKHEAYTMMKDLEATYATAARRIDQMKVADVQSVKHGRWIRTDKSIGVETVYACSECGYLVRESDRTNYCGDCGSKMDIVYQDDKVTAIKVTGW